MHSQKVEIETPDGSCDAYTLTPDNNKKLPVVIVMMDAFGVRPSLIDSAKRISEQGYFVLVPNLLYRNRPIQDFDTQPPKLNMDDLKQRIGDIMPIIRSYSRAYSKTDMTAYLNFIERHEATQDRSLALAGYCFSARVAMEMTAANPSKVQALASFHGGNLATEQETSPHHLIPKIECEMYFAHADNDSSMPPQQIERLEDELSKSQQKYQSKIYAGAGHGFTASDLPAYSEAADQRHEEALFDLLKRNLHT